MRRISSKRTWWQKKVLPIFGISFCGLFALIWTAGALNGQVPAAPALIPLGMGLFVYVLSRWLVFPLMDEVYLSNDDVIVRNAGEEDSFPITNIINVNASVMMNPERITLTLREPCRFGREVIFSPPDRWQWPWTLFMPHPLADELIRRANQLPPS